MWRVNIVDSSLQFIHATVGYPGSIHGAHVLRLSGPYSMAQNEQILYGRTRDISGVDIGPLLAGDSAYPLTSWLMKLYPDRGYLTPEGRKFNKKFSTLRCLVEHIFAMLKSRWQIVMKNIELKTTTLTKTVVASCVLHNICIERGGLYDDDCDSEDDSGNEDEDRIVFGQ